jgi:hypothetical protein
MKTNALIATRDEFDNLVDFFARHQLRAADYAQVNAPTLTVALAARFLTTVDWYDAHDWHTSSTQSKDAELFNAARAIEPRLADLDNFASLSAMCEFDCGQFSSALKAKISFLRQDTP